MNNLKTQAKEILEKYNQKDIIPYIENSDKLAQQVLDIDFEELQELYNKTFEKIQIDLDELTPIKSINPDKLSNEELNRLKCIGENIIKEGKFAVATMAGGQGTRLGCNGPKGIYKINLQEQDKYLFEIIVDTLKRANKKYNVIIPWYIMTSRENNEETIKFLEEKAYFGYPKDSVAIFKQEELPLINKDGKIIMENEETIKQASNGNGGIFKSMLKKGVISDLENKNIEWIFIGSVDNILLKYVDPLLIGLTISEKNQIGTRTVLKRNPEEKVGVICKKNNYVKVIEYTEIPQNMAKLTDEYGELVFGESHIMCNLFSIEAIKKASTKDMQYHIALKKSKYFEDGKIIEPDEPNCYKFEQFIFDSFKLFENISVLRGKREEDFAPLKNKTGEDSPETAKKLYENYWKN